MLVEDHQEGQIVVRLFQYRRRFALQGKRHRTLSPGSPFGAILDRQIRHRFFIRLRDPIDALLKSLLRFLRFPHLIVCHRQ